MKYIEGVYSFGVNIKYISYLENSDVFNTRDEIYLVFRENKVNLPIILYFYRLHATEKGSAENTK